MAYSKRYAGGFVNRPATTTPADAAFLNAVESALLQLLGEDPAADEVGVWVPASNRFVFQKLTNANIDPAAAIARSKLDFGAGLVNADISATAAIAKSKLASLAITDADVAAGAGIAKSKLAALAIAQSDMAAGNKVTRTLASAGPPASPANGDIWIAELADSAATQWAFVYRSATADAYKWHFIGGPALFATNGASVTIAAGPWQTIGPGIAVPRSGHYLSEIGANFYSDYAGANTNYLAAGVDTTPVGQIQTTLTLNGYWEHLQGKHTVVLTSGQTYSLLGNGGGGGNVTFQDRYIEILPIRIS